MSEDSKTHPQSDLPVTARVFIIGKAQYNVIQARDYLIQKGIEAVGMFTVRDAFQNFAKNKPTHAFFAASLTARKIDSIAAMFMKSADCICYVFPDDASLSANMTELKNSNLENKINFNLSGPGIHRIIETWLKVQNKGHIEKAKAEARKAVQQKAEATPEPAAKPKEKKKWFEEPSEELIQAEEKKRLSRKEKRKRVAELKAQQDEERKRALREITSRQDSINSETDGQNTASQTSGESSTPLWFEVDPNSAPQTPPRKAKRLHWSQRLKAEDDPGDEKSNEKKKQRKLHWSEKLQISVPSKKRKKKKPFQKTGPLLTSDPTTQIVEPSSPSEDIDLTEFVKAVTPTPHLGKVIVADEVDITTSGMHLGKTDETRLGSVTVFEEKQDETGTVRSAVADQAAQVASAPETTEQPLKISQVVENEAPVEIQSSEHVPELQRLYFEGTKVGVVTLKNQSFLGYAIFNFSGEAPNINDLSTHVRSEFEQYRLREFGVAPTEGDSIEVTHFEHTSELLKLDSLIRSQEGEHIRFIEGTEQPISIEGSVQADMLAVDATRFEPFLPVEFEVFLRLELNQKYVNYVCAGESITEKKKQKLLEKNITHLHIKLTDRPLFEEYCKIAFILTKSKQAEKLAA